jgi:hypothetical protein
MVVSRSKGVRGNSLFRSGLLPRFSFGGVGGPECLWLKTSSLGGVGGRPLKLVAVPESLGGVGGGRPGFSSLGRDRERVGRPRCVSLSGGAGGDRLLFSFEALRLLRPPTLEDSPASSTTGSVVPISPRSADGLRTTRISRSAMLSSLRPRCLERSACHSAFSMTRSVKCCCDASALMPVMIGSFSARAASCAFSRSAASFVLVTPLMNLTNRSPYRSGGIADICDSVFARPLMKCSMRLMTEYYNSLAVVDKSWFAITYMCETVDDTQVVDFFTWGIILMCGLEATIIGIEVKVSLRILQLIRHFA